MNVGARVRLRHDVDRYPHFLAPAGATGTVTTWDDQVVTVRLDALVPGAEEWGNEIVWSVRDGDDPTLDLAPEGRPATAAARRGFREAMLDLARERRPDLTWRLKEDDADLADHPDADRPPGTSGSWGEA